MGDGKIVDNKDLLERTKKFAEDVIELAVKLSGDQINSVLVKQLVRSGTSVGANYREACEGESAKDFSHKVKLAKKEARESEYWLELLHKVNPGSVNEISRLTDESSQLVRIFSAISQKFKTKKS